MKTNKTILGFTGQIASGKGTACKYLTEKHGAVSTRFSTMLRDVLDRIYMEQTRENMQDISLALRETFGDDLLASVIAKDVEKESADLIVIDGVRREPDIKYLKKLPGFHLIAISADQKIRYERITKRGENADDNSKTFEEFQADEQKEAEQHIKEVMETAEFTINNNGTLDELHEQIGDILKEVRN